jgi:hypothetical protein
MQIDEATASRPDVIHFDGEGARLNALRARHGRFAIVFLCEPAAEIESRPRGNPAVLGNESVRPEALRPRLSASLPLERFDNPLRSGDKSSGLVAFSRHLIWPRAAVCREFEVMSYCVRRA